MKPNISAPKDVARALRKADIMQYWTPEADFNALLAECLVEFDGRNLAHAEGWGFGKQRWAGLLSEQAGDRPRLVFKFGHGVTVECGVEIVGTHRIKEGIWRWAWDELSKLGWRELKLKPYYSVLGGVGVLELGKKCRFDRLTTGTFACEVREAEGLAALAARIINGKGIFRDGSEGEVRYIVFQTPHLSGKGSSGMEQFTKVSET